MKPLLTEVIRRVERPAAFRRLCVETIRNGNNAQNVQPAAFRRLCVETWDEWAEFYKPFPAAFRRLCVETQEQRKTQCKAGQPPSGGCVLKLTS